MHNHHALALAGLLHDIGKFMVRADAPGLQSWDDEAKRAHGYKHAMLSDSFVGQYVPERWRSDVRGPVGRHHRPQTPEDRIVQLADWLSAGERDEPPESEPKIYPKQLLSIFASIDLGGKKLSEEQRQKAFLPLRSLALKQDTLFPKEAWSADEIDAAYRTMWDDFVHELDTLKEKHKEHGDLNIYLESLLLLMQRYTWAIPSSYYGALPDISLYDHSRMTGALAAALSALPETTISDLLSQPKTDTPVALLVGGDISGVQDFIYTINTSKATSALRGRSFYLQLLTEAIARYVLRRLDLPITNLIYQGGGNFFILARASDKDRLEDVQREISRVLLQQHRGNLYIALAGEPLTASDFFDGRLSTKWSELAEQQQAMKLRRFAELEPDELQWLFAPQGHGGNEDKQCQVCGREHPATEEIEEVRKCPVCRSFEALGNELRTARFLAIEHLPESLPPAINRNDPPAPYQDVLRQFGMKAHLLKDVKDTPATSNPMTLLAVKDEALDDLHPGPKLAIGRRFLVNVTPTITQQEIDRARQAGLSELPRPDSIKPFEVLTWQSTGIKRLGVLRMDVDNLGRLFSDGLGQKATLSRVAGLSFAINLFFEGWVEALAEQKQRPSRPDGWTDRLYSIYSGGDDLFFVGSWDAVVDFARQVRKDLGEYAVHHPAITASAGIVLVGGKYPLAQAARDAGEAEHAAKAFRQGEDAKDAISFLGQVQPWERFGLSDEKSMETVVGLAMLLDDLVEKGAPKSLIRNLSQLYAQYAQAEQRRKEAGEDENRAGEPQPLWGPWMWRGYYLLKRSNEQAIQELGDALHKKNFRNMAWMGLAARWAELLTR